jgi:hypothetical protein
MHASRAVVLSLLLAMHDMMPPLCPCMHARPPTSTWTDRDVSAYMAIYVVSYTLWLPYAGGARPIAKYGSID